MRTTGQTMDEVTDYIVNRVHTTRQGSEAFSAGLEKLEDHVLDFMENELGSELKSLKYAEELLQKLQKENTVLEEQVN